MEQTQGLIPKCQGLLLSHIFLSLENIFSPLLGHTCDSVQGLSRALHSGIISGIFGGSSTVPGMKPVQG